MASIRLDKKTEYLEVTCEGPVLCERSGTIGGKAKQRRTKLVSARAAATDLDELRRAKKREGFRETKAVDVKKRVVAYMKSSSAAQQLALLAWMASLGPALRKSVRYPKGGLLNVEAEQELRRFELAANLFAEADRAYWLHHDPATLPYVPITTLGSASAPMLRAVDAGLTKPWKAAAKGAVAPDYAPAKQLLAPIAADERSNFRREARVLLSVVALREGKPRETLARLDVKEGAVPRDNAMLTGAAYLALGNTAAAAACFRGSVMNEGHLAEARGDLAEAERCYHEGLEYPGWAARPYARLRSKRLRERVGAREYARLVAARTTKANAGKIVISQPADFHARFAEIADALRAKRQITTPKKPLSEEAIANLRLATKRRGDGEGVALPESAKTILRYDRGFTLFDGSKPLLESIVGARRKVVPSVNVQKLVRKVVARDDTTGLRALSRLPADVPMWNVAEDLPACIPLASPGDQELFIYIGVPDEAGEYPIARFDDPPELWISEASLIHYVLSNAEDVVDCKIDFELLLKKAKKRNQRHREGWSTHKKLAAVLARI